MRTDQQIRKEIIALSDGSVAARVVLTTRPSWDELNKIFKGRERVLAQVAYDWLHERSNLKPSQYGRKAVDWGRVAWFGLCIVSLGAAVATFCHIVNI